MIVGRWTSDVVLFSTVASRTLDILQGSVATHMRCSRKALDRNLCSINGPNADRGQFRSVAVKTVALISNKLEAIFAVFSLIAFIAVTAVHMFLFILFNLSVHSLKQ